MDWPSLKAWGASAKPFFDKISYCIMWLKGIVKPFDWNINQGSVWKIKEADPISKSLSCVCF